ncbi:flagellar biosynthetic protein FliO [Cohnella lubricantis]|uniref:Flagellar biosynthetic protein FliO n=1 Tax=Cohnella lubricantis TaxID=2163172 RepID=A0A841TD67_9BACL|nr:flagellar biosynthetic protein FliO [Cohnella lubricantis]MBB6679403.1 flagellar biosynthetic protein FliO [Cohnella lubricantis]MBP2117485.1 flagellar protein FliO/FliZ [Cohnella lubricantis]
MDYGLQLLRIVLVLAFVVGLIIFLLRYIGKRNRGWWMNRTLRSLGGLSVGTNKSLQIVEWNGRIYVLGVGEDVTLLDSITDADTVAALLAEHDSANAETQKPLPAWLRRFAARGRTEEAQQQGGGSARQSSFEQTLEKRLRELSDRRQKVEQLLDQSRSGERTDEP